MADETFLEAKKIDGEFVIVITGWPQRLPDVESIVAAAYGHDAVLGPDAEPSPDPSEFLDDDTGQIVDDRRYRVWFKALNEHQGANIGWELYTYDELRNRVRAALSVKQRTAPAPK